MKGIYWQTLTFKKSVIYITKVNCMSYTPLCNTTWTCLSILVRSRMGNYPILVHKLRSLSEYYHLPVKDVCHTGRNCFNLFQNSFSSNTADAHPGVSGCQKARNFLRNSKLLIARSTIQPKLSKIKNNLPFFKEF